LDDRYESGRPVQFEDGISQRAGYHQGRSKATQEHTLLIGARDDKAGNTNIIANAYLHPS
jgi:hypothetical protein